jgi:hypothetical protein
LAMVSTWLRFGMSAGDTALARRGGNGSRRAKTGAGRQ